MATAPLELKVLMAQDTVLAACPNGHMCYALWCVKARRWRFRVWVLKHALRSGAGLPTQWVPAWIAVQDLV
jgi:hypothetical protein